MVEEWLLLSLSVSQLSLENLTLELDPRTLLSKPANGVIMFLVPFLKLFTPSPILLYAPGGSTQSVAGASFLFDVGAISTSPSITAGNLAADDHRGTFVRRETAS